MNKPPLHRRFAGMGTFLLIGQIAAVHILGFGVPFCLYVIFYQLGLDISTAVYLLVVLALCLTAALIWVEIFGIIGVKKFGHSPLIYPPATAIIAAYLPNERHTILETIQEFRKIDYAGKLQIILAYNTDVSLQIETAMQKIAAQDPRFLPLRVLGSSSKATNINSILPYVTGEFVGIFDADHHPDPDSFNRAWGWLDRGYDLVQGHCVIRNGSDSWVSKLIAVEFEIIYALCHPGRNSMHDFGIFGGSNGFWRTSILRSIKMNGAMLTEDIDSSIRSLLAGYKIATDPYLISKELAPVSLHSLWNQRMRWAQGWFQVSMKHTWEGFHAKNLTIRQRLGMVHLLGWRELYPWISMQIPPLMAFWIWRDHGISNLNWFIPIFIATTIFTQLTGPLQICVAYIVAHKDIKKNIHWFWLYLFASSLFYTTLKNTICLISQLKEVFGHREWKVTPRSTDAATRAHSPSRFLSA